MAIPRIHTKAKRGAIRLREVEVRDSRKRSRKERHHKPKHSVESERGCVDHDLPPTSGDGGELKETNENRRWGGMRKNRVAIYITHAHISKNRGIRIGSWSHV